MRSGLSHTTQQRPLPISAIGKGRLHFLPAGMRSPFFLADEQCTKVATSVFHLTTHCPHFRPIMREKEKRGIGARHFFANFAVKATRAITTRLYTYKK